MALSADGRTLYPFLEGPLAGDDPLNRRVYEFHVAERRYTRRSWTYRMSAPGTLVSDATAYGLKFPYVTVEAVLPLDRDSLAFVNDTNFGSSGRDPDLPDYSDFIIVKVRD